MSFDVSRYVQRVRRLADLSQRDLAARTGINRAVIGQFETGARTPSPEVLDQILALAGLRLAVLDRAGDEVSPAPADPIRDNGGRRLPVHLDVADREPGWRFCHPHYDRDHPVAPYLMRVARDEQRALDGLDGLDGDQLTATELWAQRAAAAARRQAERRAKMLAAEPAPECECELECHESGPCVPDCACQCEPMGRRPRQVG